MEEVDFSCFDSEVIELINDLNLVLKVSPEGKEWWSRWLASRYRIRLCDRYNQFLEMKQCDNARLLRDLAKRNAKYSREYKKACYSDFSLEQTLF